MNIDDEFENVLNAFDIINDEFINTYFDEVSEDFKTDNILDLIDKSENADEFFEEIENYD